MCLIDGLNDKNHLDMIYRFFFSLFSVIILNVLFVFIVLLFCQMYYRLAKVEDIQRVKAVMEGQDQTQQRHMEGMAQPV